MEKEVEFLDNRIVVASRLSLFTFIDSHETWYERYTTESRSDTVGGETNLRGLTDASVIYF